MGSAFYMKLGRRREAVYEGTGPSTLAPKDSLIPARLPKLRRLGGIGLLSFIEGELGCNVLEA